MTGHRMMTSHRPRRRLLAALALAVGVVSGAAVPTASAVRAQELQWATQAGGSGQDQGDAIAVTAGGESYATGDFVGTATFGAGEANETTLTSAGSSDPFVAKYASDGALLWATQGDGSGQGQGLGIAVDKGGASYVIGEFQGTVTFGAGEANETTLTAAGELDIFVAKYGPDGALAWATRAGGSGEDSGEAVAVTRRGKSYVTGLFEGTATFGAGERNETTLTSSGGLDIFVASYDRHGALLWASRAGSNMRDQGAGIAVTTGGESYVTGRFQGTATFGAGDPNEITLSSLGGSDIFVAKYDPDGALLWASPAGGGSPDIAMGIGITAGGESYVSGWFAGTATFGAGEANETTLTTAAFDDIFVAKYDSGGALAWVTQAGGRGRDQGAGIAVTRRGKSYVTGSFTGTATFGAGEANETTLASAGSDDIFVAKYGNDGKLLFATRAGGSGRDRGQGIGSTALGDSYVTGFFDGTATFGAGEANETPLTSAAGSDIFVAKYR